MLRYMKEIMIEIKESMPKTYLGKKSRRLSDGLERGGEKRKSGLVRFYLN